MIKIFADTANIEEIKELEKNSLISGYTCNPTIMRKAGVTDYERFCKSVLEVTNKPISFEVFADDFDEMERQAKIISSWGDNIYVKIPITNTKGESAVGIINKLTESIKINVTAVTEWNQYEKIVPEFPMIISIFAGRIADTGRDPKRFFEYDFPNAEYLWASPREVLNIYQAEEAGADIITVTPELIKKYIAMKNKDLLELSLDTVKMFFNDGQAAGYKI